MNKIKESIIVRGIAASLQAMNMPTFQNLKDLILNAGLKL